MCTEENVHINDVTVLLNVWIGWRYLFDVGLYCFRHIDTVFYIKPEILKTNINCIVK